ncbi:hypothetical protein ABPG77_005452 [Micractinium sp. CCAP 211/92]
MFRGSTAQIGRSPGRAQHGLHSKLSHNPVTQHKLQLHGLKMTHVIAAGVNNRRVHVCSARTAPPQPRQRLRSCHSYGVCAESAAEEGEGRTNGSKGCAAASATALGSGAPPAADQPPLLEVCSLSARVAATRGHLTRKGGVRAGDEGAPGHQQILHGVSLSLRQGEAAALMGKNGSGKSTLAKARPETPEPGWGLGSSPAAARTLMCFARPRLPGSLLN